MIPKRRRHRGEVAGNRNLRDKENRIRKRDGEEERFHDGFILGARRTSGRAPGHGIGGDRKRMA
jgi:hypothetical protein